MASRNSFFFFFTILLSLSLFISSSSSVDDDDDATVFFFDAPTHPYLRHQAATASMSLMELAAAVSVLLGVAPPLHLSTQSSSKLNELLLPNPFDRPRHVFTLEVPLAQGSQETMLSDTATLSSAYKSKVVSSSSTVQIELPDREQVAFVSMDKPDTDSLVSITDKDINDFAQSFGGSYFSDDLEALSGDLSLPLPSGSRIKLQMSKKADREFATGLIFMINNINRRMEIKQDLSGSDSDIAELLGGYFGGIKSLQDEYGSEDIAQQGMELLLITLSRAFDFLQTRHNGQIVAVILFRNAEPAQPQKILDVTFDSRPSPRLLEEAKTLPNSTIVAELVLVRRTLAWVTAVLLLIATIIGVYLLLNMPLTRDTLLYSNVKLD